MHIDAAVDLDAIGARRLVEQVPEGSAMDAEAEAAGFPIAVLERQHAAPRTRAAVEACDARAARERALEQSHAAEDRETGRLQQQAGADRGWLRGALEDAHVPSGAAQQDGAGKTCDTRAD